MIRWSLLLLFLFTHLNAVEVGAPAPDFELQSHEGKLVKLSDYQGKIVVLEWTNLQCPFVKAFYEPGMMQKWQESLTAKGVVWLQVLSSAPGKQGFVSDATAAQKLYQDQKMKSTAFLLDPTGKTGKVYQAKTTPHFYVIDPQGKLVYEGAIDSGSRPRYDEKAENYVLKAVEELLGGKLVSTPKTKPYGCSVKY